MFSGVLRGFLLTLVIAVGLPFLFLMIPAATMFMLLIPLWSLGAIAVLFFGALALGQTNSALGTALAAALILAGYFVPNFAISSECGKGLVKFEPVSISQFDKVVFDNASYSILQNSDSPAFREMLLSSQVFEIQREATGSIKAAKSFEIVSSTSCRGQECGRRSSPAIKQRKQSSIVYRRTTLKPRSWKEDTF